MSEEEERVMTIENMLEDESNIEHEGSSSFIDEYKIENPSPLDNPLLRKRLQYKALVLSKADPHRPADQTYTLKHHPTAPSEADPNKFEEIPIECCEDSLIYQCKQEQPKLMICVTMYNEPYSQLVQSLAGLYRAYYELVHWDEDFRNKVHIVIVIDGYDRINRETLEKMERAGIYSAFETAPYVSAELTSDKAKHFIKFKNLSFINSETMKTGVNGEPSNVRYGTNNVGHCFSRVMSFPDWLNALSDKEKNNFSIDSYPIQNFMLGNSETGKSEKNIFFNIPMPIHMVIKHKNQGKIESHKWFFKGFCEYMDPKFVQIIDVGSIPLWNSISYLIKHMEVNQKIGGCSGEIEVILSEKDADNKPYTFFESILLRSQYVEYKISHYLDKSFESAFGFVSVLPGAFSTFRWLAIKGDPLQKFLKGAKDEFGDMNKFFECSTANKYLAEDRVM